MTDAWPRRERWSRGALLALAAVLALAVALRALGIDYSLWNDEVASTKFAAAPVRLLWSDWMVRETNPPLYYTLLGGWWSLFGGSDVALRAMSAVIGCVGVAFVFLLGRQVGGTRTGAIAGALVAASAQNILYSQQVRGYILGYTAGVAAVLATLLFLASASGRARGRGGALVGYVAATAVALYAHTTFVLLPALVGAFVLGRLLLLRPRPWRPVVEWLLANLIVLAIWAWWAHITLLQARSRATIGWINTPSLPYAIRMTLESYAPWGFGPLQLLVAALAWAAAGWATWRWRARPDLLLLPFLAVATPALLYLLSLKVPVFLNRTVYWASAPFLVTVAAGIATLRPRALFAGALAIAAVASVAGWLAWYPGREIEPWRGIVAAIEHQEPGAVVVVSGKGPALALRRYCRPPGCDLRIVGLSSPSTDTWASGFPVPDMIDPRTAPALSRAGRDVVAVRWMSQDPLAVLPPTGQATRLAIPPGQGDNIGAASWRPR